MRLSQKDALDDYHSALEQLEKIYVGMSCVPMRVIHELEGSRHLARIRRRKDIATDSR